MHGVAYFEQRYQLFCVPAQQRRPRNAPLRIIVQPPAVGQAEGERQEVGARAELVRQQQAAGAQQGLAALQRGRHIARRVQHVRREHRIA